MNTRNILISFVVLSVLIVSTLSSKLQPIQAQGPTVGTEQWSITYGGTNLDRAHFIQQTNDGGVIFAGRVSSFGASSTDLWVVKVDDAGSIVWQKRYGGVDADLAYSIHTTSDGGFIIAGSTYTFGAGGVDIWILRLNSSGNIMWQKTYGGSGDDWAFFIETTSDGGSILVGKTASFGAGNEDAWVLKLNNNGTVAWQKTYGGIWNDEAWSIQETSDGGFIFTGRAWSFGSGNFADIWVVKLYSNGAIAWQKIYQHSSSGGLGEDIQQTPDGGFIIAGSTRTNYGFPIDVYILKLYGNGSIAWQKTYGGTDWDWAVSLQQLPGGGFMVAGVTESFGAESGDDRIWALKLNNDGAVSSQNTYGGTSPVDESTSIINTVDNGFVIGGYTSSFGAGSDDAWLLKLNSEGVILGYPAMGSSDVAAINASANMLNTNATVRNTSVYPSNTYVTSYDTNSVANVLYRVREYSVAGQILVQEDTLENGKVIQNSYPLGYAVVTITNHSKETRVVTVSNASGNYSSSIGADEGDSLSVRVDLIYRRNNTDFLQIQYASVPAAPVVYLETLPFTVSSETAVQKDFRFGGPLPLPYLTPPSVPHHHIDDTALMYHHFQQALDYTFEILNVSLDYNLPIKVYAFDLNMETDRARYNGGDASIHVGGAASNSQDPDRPMNREWHEYFHHLMQDTIVMPTVLPPDANHDGFINSTTADSWREGWAELWPMILAEHLGQSQPSVYADKGDFEIDITPWTLLEQDSGGIWRSAEEYGVASILWDLYDSGDSDKDNDPMNMWATYLWWLLVRQNPDGSYRHVGTFYEVYNLLITALPERQADIDEIFENHGFYGDRGWIIQDRVPLQEGNKTRDTGEGIGYGGRENRLDAPYFDGAFLLVNLVSEQGQPVENGTLLIKIEFEPPDDVYNYSYQYNLFSATNNMVYIPAPWTDYSATVTVQALNSPTLPFSISNLDFWNMIPNSGRDYVAEKTFVIERKVFLPLIVK